MKNIKILLITFIINFCFILNVFAQGNVSISTNSLNITKGESKTFTITSNNSAGRIDISSTDNSIASVSKSSTFLDMTSDTITVTANSVGTTTIKVYIADMTTYDDEDLSGKTYTINVNVSDVVKEETKKEDNKKIYSWIVDGKKIDKLLDVDTTIVLNKNNIKKIKQVSNYADGIFINFKHNGSLPNGVSIKIYVGDKFDNGDVVSVYYYNENKNTLELKIESVKVQEEYVEFSIEHCSNYFVTMSNLKTNNNKSNNVFPLIIISELVIVFGIIIVYILKTKKSKPTN